MQGSIRVRHEHLPIILADINSGDSSVETSQRELIGLRNPEHDTHEPPVKPAVTDDGNTICFMTVTVQQFLPNLPRSSHRLL